ncbi:hypothetical protein DBR24_05145, partial [Pseudomonas sp. HMWF006]
MQSITIRALEFFHPSGCAFQCLPRSVLRPSRLGFLPFCPAVSPVRQPNYPPPRSAPKHWPM